MIKTKQDSNYRENNFLGSDNKSDSNYDDNKILFSSSDITLMVYAELSNLKKKFNSLAGCSKIYVDDLNHLVSLFTYKYIINYLKHKYTPVYLTFEEPESSYEKFSVRDLMFYFVYDEDYERQKSIYNEILATPKSFLDRKLKDLNFVEKLFRAQTVLTREEFYDLFHHSKVRILIQSNNLPITYGQKKNIKTIFPNVQPFIKQLKISDSLKSNISAFINTHAFSRNDIVESLVEAMNNACQSSQGLDKFLICWAKQQYHLRDLIKDKNGNYKPELFHLYAMISSYDYALNIEVSKTGILYSQIDSDYTILLDFSDIEDEDTRDTKLSDLDLSDL